MRKMPIGSRAMVDVLTEDAYLQRSNNNPETMADMHLSIGIEKEGYVYPVIANGNLAAVVGVKDYGPYLKYTKPRTDKEREEYSAKNIIDLENNNDGVRGMIEKAAQLEAAEKTVLLSKDNVTQFVIKQEDTPEFALLKKAINQKGIDMTAYKHRHGSDYSNNIRLLATSNNITFGKMKAIASASDIEVEVIMRDKPGCVNPMGEELHAIII